MLEKWLHLAFGQKVGWPCKGLTKYKKPNKVVQFRIGLAFNKSNGQWDIERWSEPIPMPVILAPGETKLLENVKAFIPVDGLTSLKHYWLVLAVEIDGSGGPGYTYAHSNKGVL